MKVVITAGGTGGHIYPALAIIDKIKEKEPDSEFIYIGTHNRMEKDIVPSHGIRYEAIKIYGFNKSLSRLKEDLEDIYLIPAAIIKVKKILKEFKPDVVIGVGGYVTYPVIKAAHSLKIKIFIHEQNSIPGKSNLALQRIVDLVGVSFPDSKKYFNKTKAIVTGNPCATNALKVKKISKTDYGVKKNSKTVLVVNGSLGSKAINTKMVPFLKSIKNESYEVIYVTGKNYYDEYKENKFPENVHLVPFVDNLSGLMKDIDVIVTRSGASTVSEIEALQVPPIFIPSPYVANNHQYYNALSILNSKAGLMIEEKDLNETILNDFIKSIIEDEKTTKLFKDNLAKLAHLDSADIIYEEIKRII